MNINQAFPSKYFKSDDLEPGQPKTLTIERCVVELVGKEGEKENKPVLYFSNADQGLVLNPTKAFIIQAAYGEETDYWTGQPIVIKRGTTRFGNKMVPCIDVEIPTAAPARPPVPHTAVGNAVRGVVQRQGRPTPPPQQQYVGPEEEYDPLG